MYLAHKIWKKNWKLLIRAKDLDLDTGRREVDLNDSEEELAEKAALAARSKSYKIYKIFC